MQIAAADPQLAVDHRRVVEDEILFPGRCAIVFNQGKRLLHQRFGQLLGVGNGCRTADKLRFGTVKLTNPLQSSNQVGQMAAINAAIIVQFINDEIAEVFKGLGPLGVVWQNAAMQHVWIREHNIGPFSNGTAGVLRRIAIVGESADIGTHRFHQSIELLQLIFGQRLGRKQIHGSCPRIGH